MISWSCTLEHLITLVKAITILTLDMRITAVIAVRSPERYSNTGKSVIWIE